MIFTLSFFMGIFMFIHYGCSFLKHDSDKSTKILMFYIFAIVSCSVLIMVYSFAKAMDDLIFACLAALFLQVIRDFYLWYHGITIKRFGRLLHRIKPFNFIKQFKKVL